jgi:hypothetical protein
MADWPTAEELGKVLGVNEDPADWTDMLERIMAAAIAITKHEVGFWDEGTDEPDEMLAQGALRIAERLAERPEVAIAEAIAGRGGTALLSDPALVTLIYGHRRRFAIS